MLAPANVTVFGDPAASNSVSTNFTRTSALNTNTNGIAAVPTGSTEPERNPRRIRIALGVGLSVGSVLICLCLALVIRRYRRDKMKRSISSDNKSPTIAVEEDQAPYLQHKGELDAQGNSKHELAAEQKRYGLEGDIEIHEMPSPANIGELGGSGRTELRSAEHSQELKA
ncbi:MAG: hypothetical protein Q9169_006160 [Polycauliona sp. 2 TL-2023]